MRDIERYIDTLIHEDDDGLNSLLAKEAEKHRLENKNCHNNIKHLRLNFAHWYRCDCGWETKRSYVG